MGTDKNIKLHIVTDIKVNCINHHLKQQQQQQHWPGVYDWLEVKYGMAGHFLNTSQYQFEWYDKLLSLGEFLIYKKRRPLSIPIPLDMPKTKKDPNKPKGLKSAYIFFVESERSEQERNGTQLPFSEFSKQCGVKWGEMDDEEKAPFTKLSEQDRRRHENEMSSYIPPPRRVGDSDSDDEGPKRKKKKKKDPNAPKRPITAYFFFAGDVRPDIRKDKPDLPITEVATLIGQKWRELTSDDKKPYEAQASKDKIRYENEMERYNQHGSY